MAIQVGWATADITPARNTFLQGQFHTRISTHVNDPLTATALALDGGSEGATDQAILVSADVVGIRAEVQERVRALAAPRLSGFDPRKLFMNATHTHTAPSFQEGNYVAPAGSDPLPPAEYAEFFARKAADAAVRAWEQRAPGALANAFSHAAVGRNRRAAYLDGSSRMYGKTSDPLFDSIEGYEDDGIDLLFFWNERRDLTGVLINLACPFQLDEHAEYISASFWHETRVALRQRFGPDLFVLSQCSAAGDQSPHPILYKGLEAEMRKRRGLTERQELARRIAQAVADGFESAVPAIRSDAPFRHLVGTLELPARAVTETEFSQAEAEVSRCETEAPKDFRHASILHCMKQRALRVMKRFREQGPHPIWTMELHTLRMGDVALVTNPFELFLDFGIRMKARSPAQQTFVVQLACDSAGYLPTAKAVRGRGYGAEVASTKVGPEGGQVLVERTLQATQSLWPNGDVQG
ncbi:MAG: hypothetical protein AMXMBFR7_39120 [Planctomycetota bacterium]